jgi:16S rRNA (cytidine1402-2'-O)-methyltransferase
MSGPFLFYGFLPARAAERGKVLTELARLAYALVFYEAPHRVLDTVYDLARILGATRQAVLARELTKVFEQVHACALGELASWLEQDPDRSRGELVLMVSAPVETAPQDALAEKALRVLIEELAPAQAARLAAHISGVPRAPLYDLALKLRAQQQP